MGLTFIELIISMLVITISFVGIFLGIVVAYRAQSVPFVQAQARMIAQYYLDEILTKSYPSVLPCVAPSKIKDKAQSVCDYITEENHYLPLTDIEGKIINEYQAYQVKVHISKAEAFSIPAVLIDVHVHHPEINGLRLSAIKVKAHE